MFNPSISVDVVIDALAGFVDLFLDGGMCHRAQQNRVPTPTGPNYAILTELRTVKLSTPITELHPEYDAVEIESRLQIDVQIDVYGEYAGDQTQALVAAFAAGWGVEQFPEYVRPLFMSDPLQAPSVTGEQQYAPRWTVTASLQYNPHVAVPQGYAQVLGINTTRQADD